MQDWSKYIERPIADVLPELAAEDFRVTSDECAIAGFRNINIVTMFAGENTKQPIGDSP